MAEPQHPSSKTKYVLKALDSYQAALAIAGDKRAFSLLYKRWHPRFLRFACRLSGNTEEAQDILQDAAIKIAGNIHKLQDPERFSAWAYTIIRRRAADQIKANIRRRNIQAQISEEALEADIIFSHDEDHIKRLSLKQALSRLDETDRLLLTLFYLDGLTGVEMAAAMGLPLGTIKSRLFTARKKLHAHMQPTPQTGDENE